MNRKTHLNPTDQKVLKVIARTTALRLPPPTVRELRDEAKRSLGAITSSLRYLEAHEYIVRDGDRGRSRCFRIHPKRIAYQRHFSGAFVRSYYQVI